MFETMMDLIVRISGSPDGGVGSFDIPSYNAVCTRERLSRVEGFRPDILCRKCAINPRRGWVPSRVDV